MSDQDYSEEAVCSRCKRRVMQGRTARYDHDDCEPTPIDPARIREAIRRGERAAAEYLTREGHPEEALKFKVAR